MTVSSTTPTTPSPTAALAAAATSTAATKAANDKNYDTFLKMMTTQIKNQDPLNPMSADQLAVQLATFSGVEQQTKTNDLLTQMLSQNNLGAMSQVVGWVGKEARLAAPAYFDGSTPITLSPNPAADADKAVLVVTDQAGNEVSRTELPVSTVDYKWPGLDSSGNPLPKGVYSFSLDSYQGDSLLGTTDVEYYGKISEIRNSANGVSAMLPGGVEALTSLITAIREPAAN
ncbi:flagellar basal body rod modification protein [bacterium]|nr:flagellar basal body rod modification protein [bacterium]